MKDYNLVLKNPIDLTNIEKKYINIFLKTHEMKEMLEKISERIVLKNIKNV
jgi:hypothetical protein